MDSCLIANGNSGILIRGVNNLVISNNNLSQVVTGITVGEKPRPPEEIALNQISIRNNIIQAERTGIIFYENSYTTISIKSNELLISAADSTTGISIDFSTDVILQNTVIKGNDITGGEIGIGITNNTDVGISGNVLTGDVNGSSTFGIFISNGSEAFISNNSIINFLTGISLNMVSNPVIVENSISAINLTVEPYSGILSVSSNGQIRKNTIQHHLNGIELGSSSPSVGANTITGNKRYGIYISDNSHPNLSEQFVGSDQYPLSGYNTIRENGICNFDPGYTEFYLNNSYVNLEKGCNTIADDRGGPISCGNYLLIDGRESDKEIMATGNYWGEVNGADPTGRFSQSLTINYEGWLTEPCTYSEGESALLLSNSKGEVYDTIYSTGKTPSELTDIETRYAAANEYYYNNQYSQAKQEYEGIIQNYGNSKESLTAYSRLFTLANLMNIPPASFNQLKDFYLQKIVNQTDSLMIGTLTHLSNLCLVSAEEYFQALNNFDEQAQQNPNTDIGLYRQIDALTTSLLLPQDSTLNKGKLGKYSVNNLSDYINKLSELLKTRGKSGLLTGKEIFPTEYSLYQNYPNPFNPVTTIKYDLPKDGLVKLNVFDILGRRVATIVNEEKVAGKYEVNFNASSLASGVYVYKLQAGDFVNSKKMILLK